MTELYTGEIPLEAFEPRMPSPKMGYWKKWKMRSLRKLLILWSGLSESNRHLNLGNSRANGKPGTYEALSGAFRSVWSSWERLMLLQLVPRGRRVGTLNQNRERVPVSVGIPAAPHYSLPLSQ